MVLKKFSINSDILVSLSIFCYRSQDAIVKGAIECNLSPQNHGLIERGPVELVEHMMKKHIEQINLKFTNYLNNVDMKSGEEIKKIKMLQRILEYKVELLTPYITTWPQAATLLVEPQNLPTTLYTCMNISDDIAHLVGKRNIRLDWYSTRAVIAGMICATGLK